MVQSFRLNRETLYEKWLEINSRTVEDVFRVIWKLDSQ